jgi:hypothetical protein
MANRVLRDWTASDKIDALSSEAERFFVRLIMKADDYGNFYADERLLLSALFPLKIADITLEDVCLWRMECVRAELIQIYEHGGRKYLNIINFNQRLRTMSSKFPQVGSNPPSIGSNPPPETETEVETKEKEKLKGLTQNQKFGKEYSESDSLLNSAIRVARDNKLPPDKEFVVKCLRNFVAEIEAKTDTKQTFKLFCEHFISWMKIHGHKFTAKELPKL